MNILVDDVKNLYVEIFIIGYSEKGESIILIITDRSNGINLFSIVIDCYEISDINKTVEILNEKKIESIDILCWTHPDDDHTKGLYEIIKNYCSSKTIFLLPEGIYGKDDDVINYTVEDLEILKEINKNNSGRKYNVHSVSTNPNLSQQIKKIEFKDIVNNTTLKFEVLALAPFSPILRRRIEDEPENVKKNDFSIALLFNIGELQLFFTSDIENQTIQHISNDYISNLTFLKIPHHSSQSSNYLLNKISEIYENNKIPISCTTVYRLHGLPDLSLIRDYKKYAEFVHSTGNERNKQFEFGILEYGFEIVEKNISKVKFVGHAIEL